MTKRKEVKIYEHEYIKNNVCNKKALRGYMARKTFDDICSGLLLVESEHKTRSVFCLIQITEKEITQKKVSAYAVRQLQKRGLVARKQIYGEE